jgi:hypothetical protein
MAALGATTTAAITPATQAPEATFISVKCGIVDVSIDLQLQNNKTRCHTQQKMLEKCSELFPTRVAP